MLVDQIRSLIAGETDQVAVMSNVAAAKGPVACMHIPFGRGVCGTAWQREQTIVVPDVEQFPGHIACSSASRSEIVVPVFDKEGRVTAVLDIDSERLAAFDETDQRYLEEICRMLS